MIVADEFKKRMDSKCGKGGTGCYCCNSWDKGEKPVLRRMIRRIMKQRFRESITKQ